MDYRLQYAPKVQSVTLDLLDSLNSRIQKCSNIIDTHRMNPEINISILNEALERIFADMTSEISHLNKMSNIIRRAGKRNQRLKVKNFQIKNEDKDAERTLLDNFKRHIGDRFPMVSNIIQHRLAKAMIFRRKRILYWRFRHQEAQINDLETDPNISDTSLEPKLVVSSAQVSLQQEDKQETGATEPVISSSQIQRATTLEPDKSKMFDKSPSAVSTVTIALINDETFNFPTAPGANAKRKYEQLKKERLAAHRTVLKEIDELYYNKDSALGSSVSAQLSRTVAERELERTLETDVQIIGNIICPYCLCPLPATEVFDQRKWRNHVINDLDPYVCLFEECNEPNKLYKHRGKWLSHMHQHIQHWRCPSHRELDPFLTREEYMQHMREVHKINLGENKLLLLANRSARKPAQLFLSCPLCGRNDAEVDGPLEDHITGHLRTLAIKSLPIYEDDSSGSEQNLASHYSTPLRSRSTTEDIYSGEDTLTFGIDHEQSDLAEVEDGNFLGTNHHDLGPRRTDMWNSWVKDWISNMPTLQQHLQQTSDKDPIFQLMLQYAKESDSLPQTSQLPPQHLQQPISWRPQSQHPSLLVPNRNLNFLPANSTDENPPCNTLYVGNLPIDADEEELKAMFSKQRGYKRLCFRTKQNESMCFVEFEDNSFAARALHELYGEKLHNSTEDGIHLSYSKNPLGVRSSQPSSRASQATVAPTNFPRLTFVDESALDDQMRNLARYGDENTDDTDSNGDSDWDNLYNMDSRTSSRMGGIVRSGRDEQSFSRFKRT
ncbi:uncharacterized protein TrAFT101_004179 [Trichoderma asperellum]|uniref:uncharacterized protein n=1 Tax=Trichoderma asperellum TaxID=101201 RepID=UPI00332F1E8A|nr:hypothetical protein TrAFT101_004179 [Trichoderma asperellum]